MATVGRKFVAKFDDDASCSAYLTWSAGQMLVYNNCVFEQRYFNSLSRLQNETERHKQPVREACRVERPKLDQKYAHLIDIEATPWLAEVPSAILGIGAYRHYHAAQRYLKGLTGKPRQHKIKQSDRTLLLTRQYFVIAPSSREGWYVLSFGSKRKPGGRILFRAHRDFLIPAMVSVRLSADALTVSFNYEAPEEEDAIFLKHRKRWWNIFVRSPEKSSESRRWALTAA